MIAAVTVAVPWVPDLLADQRLGGALLEAAHVDQAGRDDLAALDGGHAGHRHEDAPPARHLDDEPERFSDASPLDQLRPDAPPFFVIHGDHDTLAPVADARRFTRELGEKSHSAR